MRFPILISPVWRPLLRLGGATPANSYLELTDGELVVRFGRLFERTFPRSEIEGAAPTRWPFWYGIGWRANFLGRVGLIGSYRGVVELRLRERTRVWGLVPCDRLAVSLEDPDAFIAALRERSAPGEGEAPAPRRRGRRKVGEGQETQG